MQHAGNMQASGTCTCRQDVLTVQEVGFVKPDHCVFLPRGTSLGIRLQARWGIKVVGFIIPDQCQKSDLRRVDVADGSGTHLVVFMKHDLVWSCCLDTPSVVT